MSGILSCTWGHVANGKWGSYGVRLSWSFVLETRQLGNGLVQDCLKGGQGE